MVRSGIYCKEYFYAINIEKQCPWTDTYTQFKEMELNKHFYPTTPNITHPQISGILPSPADTLF